MFIFPSLQTARAYRELGGKIIDRKFNPHALPLLVSEVKGRGLQVRERCALHTCVDLSHTQITHSVRA